MNRYYLACFREYRGGIHSIRQHDGVDLVEEFGQDTTGAMVLIFSEDGKERRMLPEEARAVFRTFGGPQSRSAKSPAVIQAYSDMLDTHRKQVLKTGDEDAREQLVEWLTQMSEAAPFTVDTAANIQGLFENGSTGSRMRSPFSFRLIFCTARLPAQPDTSDVEDGDSLRRAQPTI